MSKIWNKKLIIILSVLTLVFFMIMIIPSVPFFAYGDGTEEIGDLSDSKPREYSFVANEEELELIRELYGQNISRGEFYEIVHPEIFEFLDEETIDDFYEREMTWSDSSEERSSWKISLILCGNISGIFWE